GSKERGCTTKKNSRNHSETPCEDRQISVFPENVEGASRSNQPVEQGPGKNCRRNIASPRTDSQKQRLSPLFWRTSLCTDIGGSNSQPRIQSSSPHWRRGRNSLR